MRNSLKCFMLLMFLASCDSSTLVGEMKGIPGSWNQNEEISFEIPKLDSLQSYNMFLHIRNSNEYPFNNIYLIVDMNFPHGKTVTDTLEYRMAAPDGKWLGQGIGSVKESKLWYKEGVRFYEEGVYILSVSQAVRNNGEVGGVSELRGITDVGYSIEKVSK